MTCKEEIRLLY